MATAYPHGGALDLDDLDQQDQETRRYFRLQKTASTGSAGSSVVASKVPFYASLLRTADSDNSYDDEIEIDDRQPQDADSSLEESKTHESDLRSSQSKYHPTVARAQALSQACRTAYAEMRKGVATVKRGAPAEQQQPVDGPSGIQRRSFSVDMASNLNQSSMQSELPSPPPAARPPLPQRRPSQLAAESPLQDPQQESTYFSEAHSAGNTTVNTSRHTSTTSKQRRLTLKERSESISRSFKTLTSRPECAKWTAVDVAAWLGALGLDAYTPVFLENGVDGPTLLKLTVEQLSEGLHFRHDERHFRSLAMGLEDLKERRVTRIASWEWSIERVIQWLHERGLDSLEPTFRACAIHGGVLFRLTEADFVEMGVGEESPLTLRALLASIARARLVGPHPVDETLVPDWGPVKIREWLDKLHLGHLEGAFRAHGVNGALLMELDAPVLKRQLGTTEIQSIVLARAIARLRRQHYWRTSLPGKGWKRLVSGSKYLARSVRQERERRRRRHSDPLPSSRRPSAAPPTAPKRAASPARKSQSGSPPKRPPRPSMSAPPMATPQSEARTRRASSQSTIKSAMPFSFSAPPPAGPPPANDVDYSLTSS